MSKPPLAKIPNTFVRRDGVVLPEALMQDLRSIFLIDTGGTVNDQKISEEHVLNVPFRTRPADHPNAYPRLVPSERMTKEQIDAFCEPQWRHFKAREADECPNCQGKKGEGQFWARTGDRDDRMWKGVYPQRKLVSYPCPVCLQGSATVVNDIVLRCGVSAEVLMGRRDEDMWWNLPDAADPTKSRAPIENVVRTAVDTALKRGGGMFAVAAPPGTGRTFLLEWATGRIANAGIRVRYIRADEFDKAVNAHMSEGNFGSNPQIVNTMIEIPVLIIDQFEQLKEANAKGEESYSARLMRDVIHARYRAWAENAKPYVTLMAVNLTAWNQGGRDVLLDSYDRFKHGVYAALDIGGLRRSMGTDLALFPMGEENE